MRQIAATVTGNSMRQRTDSGLRPCPTLTGPALAGLALAGIVLLAACQQGRPGSAPAQTAPATKAAAQPDATVADNASAPPYTPRPAARATRHMVAAANPLAARAGRETLRAGGSAVDAAIATQLVLALVEPQSSGIGGGAFLMHFDAKSGAIDAYDGRETAPASARPDMFLKSNGEPMGFFEAVVGGRSVGVPGLLRMLEMAHKEHGRLPWKHLFEPAIALAEKGFEMSPRLRAMIVRDPYLKSFAAATVYFHDDAGKPPSVGTRIINLPYAGVLRAVAAGGADAFYSGAIARDIAWTVSNSPSNPAEMTAADLASYTARKRDPVCLPYRTWLVCGMGPPSSGGLTTLQILGLLERFDLGALRPASARAVHLVAEASRIAFADRNIYIADPDFIPVPAAGLLDPEYLSLRGREISPDGSMGEAQPGMPGTGANLRFAPGQGEEGVSTTHLSVIDDAGNAVSMTASIESAFGSRLMVRGFLLNNELTDFSFIPDRDDAPVANRVEPGKRPRSSMAPTLVFDAQGRVVMAVGSPGGSRIIGYVSKAVIAALDWGLNIQEAIDLGHFVNRNGHTELEADTPIADLKAPLEALGHTVKVRRLTSGLHGIAVDGEGLTGGADRRREGVALGD